MINFKQAHRFCKDDITKIENYENALYDNTQTWHIHHRLERTLNNEYAHSVKDLIRLRMYYNRPYYELIFLTTEEHTKLHHLQKTISEYTRSKIANSIKGERHHQYGKPLLNETKHKISEANKGRVVSEETRHKLSIANTGKASHNKGKSMSEEQKLKIALSVKNNWLKRKQKIKDANEE